ncbi:MAG: histidinol-phosphate transaminase [gamma proteobacterium endosymbiont of Lamellibrachia anaximandri]|nr:histidinol-phosphate transaminase [gamma proteobacterium endosymbiont of Lamellibrachia anaximandri]MBL3534395.1 histidinol-phosphate transaminase [gamma proteobacterium endosymbiont of Lamellibrachia anaximandri]MBL3599554.1 histidinol-phosphate transaminase [gamma proteobacterium endosymbiont of Lamellibrachia anaximandri]
MSDNEKLKQWVRPEIRALSAYHVPDPGDMIKLDAMENPYTWPDGLRREWLDLLAGVDVNRYPDPQASDLKARLRVSMSVPEGADIILGNGSDELIQMLAMSVAAPGRTVLSVDPGFVMYRMIATFCGMRYAGVSLNGDDFSLDLETLLAAIEKEQPALIFLAYPNNPTGNLFDKNAIQDVIEAAPGLVVVDEAYAPFTNESFMARLGEFDNLLVMRTVSKMGLAGLRLGLLAGPADWLGEVEKTRLPYNINVLTQVSAEFALAHQPVLDEQTFAVREARGQLFAELDGMEGVTPYPSDANFILLRVPQGRALSLFEDLKGRGVLVKNLHGAHPLLEDCLRVTVGTPSENSAFLSAISALL